MKFEKEKIQVKRRLTVVLWSVINRYGGTIIIGVQNSCMRGFFSQIWQFLLEVVIVVLEESIISLETAGFWVIRRFARAVMQS